MTKPRTNKRGDAAKAGAAMLQLMRQVARVRAINRQTARRIGYAPYDHAADYCAEYTAKSTQAMHALCASAHDADPAERAQAWGVWARIKPDLDRLAAGAHAALVKGTAV